MNDTAKTVIGIALTLIVIKTLKDLFGVFSSKGPKEFYEIPELWDRLAPGYTNAPQAERRRVQDNIPRLTAAAAAIAQAPGMLTDREGVALAALRIPQSRFELMWLNRLFTSGAMPTWSPQGVFDANGPIPNLGPYLDTFLSAQDKQIVVDIWKDLPKYNNN